MGWKDVDRPMGGQGGRFLQLEADTTTRIRILDEEPYTAYVHQIEQEVNGQRKFASVPALRNLDEDYIETSTNLYPAQPRHYIRCVEIDEDGDPVGEIKLLSGGRQIFGPLKTIYDRHGSLTQYDVEIHREGEGQETKYTVTLAPKHSDVDVEELQGMIKEDDSLEWDTLFPDITVEEQIKLFEQNGFDIDYDPAEQAMEEMTIEEAMELRMPAGKYKDKTMREVAIIDSGYLDWAKDGFTREPTVMASARLVMANIDSISAPKKEKGKKKLAAGKKKTTTASKKKKTTTSKKKKAEKPSEEEEEAVDRSDLITRVNEAFQADDRFEDAMEIVKAIQEHGNGKTRVKDLSEEELESLLEAVS